MADTISMFRIRLAEAYSLIKTEPEYLAYLAHRRKQGTLTDDECAYLVKNRRWVR